MALSTPDNHYYGKLFQLMNKALNRRSFNQLIDQDIILFAEPQIESSNDRTLAGPKYVALSPDAIPLIIDSLDERINRLQAVKQRLQYQRSVLRDVIEG